VTALIWGVLFLAALYLGNTFLVLPIFFALLALFCSTEFFDITAPRMNKTVRSIGVMLSIALPLIAAARQIQGFFNQLLPTGIMTGIFALFCAIALGLCVLLGYTALNPTSSTKDAALALFGSIYVGLPLAAIILIREMESGLFFALLTVLSVWASDSFAYIGGSLLGRHKIAPDISPKKTWEGLVFAILGSVVIWGFMLMIPNLHIPFMVPFLVGLLVAIAAFIGDLFESSIKREAGVKDSGIMLPGHGGLLDRMDSLFTASILVLLIIIIAHIILGRADLL